MKIYAAQLNLTVGDIEGNTSKIITHIKSAEKSGADLAVFPELSIMGYPPEDLLMRKGFIAEEQAALKKITKEVKNLHVIMGATYSDKSGLHNAAYHIFKNKAVVVSGKAALPNYGVFDEKRYFLPCNIVKPVIINKTRIGVLVCEDTWLADKTAAIKKHKPDLLVSINASPFEAGKLKIRHKVAKARVMQAKTPIVYVNNNGGQDELVFDGGSFMMDKTGKITASFPQFEEVGAILSGKAKTIPHEEELYNAMVLGLKDYMGKNGFKKAVLGLSGGMDSALVAVIAADAIGAENVRPVLLPSRYSSKSSITDAVDLCKNMGFKYETIKIEPAFLAFEEMLKSNFAGKKPDLTEENLQSRIRGVILMAISNKHGELLLTTGNKSEIGVGYSTLYGDSCGGFNPLKDLYKTEVFAVGRWRNKKAGRELIPENIFTKAPSAELRPDQKDQDSLPEYEVLDAILKLLVEGRKSAKEIIAKGYDKLVVEKVARLLYLSEYKRFQSAPGVKLSPTAFSKDWRFPLTNKYRK